MKVKNIEKNFIIEKIHLDTDSTGRTIITYVINGQQIEQIVSYAYFDTIMLSIREFIDILSQTSIIN